MKIYCSLVLTAKTTNPGIKEDDMFHQKEKTNIYDKFHFGTGWEPYQCSSEIFEGKGVNYK